MSSQPAFVLQTRRFHDFETLVKADEVMSLHAAIEAPAALRHRPISGRMTPLFTTTSFPYSDFVEATALCCD